jgi:hypothetical protein
LSSASPKLYRVQGEWTIQMGLNWAILVGSTAAFGWIPEADQKRFEENR